MWRENVVWWLLDYHFLRIAVERHFPCLPPNHQTWAQVVLSIVLIEVLLIHLHYIVVIIRGQILANLFCLFQDHELDIF